MIYSCCDEHRKAAVLNNPSLNGIDYLEVLDHLAPAGSPRQQTLFVTCLKVAPASLAPANVIISGGESIVDISAVWIAPALAPPAAASAAEVAYFAALPNAARVLVVRTDRAGDFSPYTLRLVNNSSEATEDAFAVTETLDGFDPQLAAVTFSFKVECGPEFDCLPAVPLCPPDTPAAPPINYLAKDYGSFRSILLDRLNQLVPNWEGSSEADLGVVLAELMAYAGDALSYQQDAVATEAYLGTSRSRISLRRHALLVDYHVHDGCNARVWIKLDVADDVFLDHTVTRFYTRAPHMPASLAIGAGNEEAALAAGVVVFEAMQDANLFPEHNQMSFYTWGDGDCCLPSGATEATLEGSFPNLAIGDVLIFQEVMGPQTGLPADADVRHRCAVRLTGVAIENGRGQPLVDPLFEAGTGAPITSAAQKPTPVTEIRWSREDALAFPICVSASFVDTSGAKQHLTAVSVVLGNVILADQGLSMPATSLGTVPAPSLYHPRGANGERCAPSAPAAFPVRFRPQIPDRPVTQAVPLPITGSPVTANGVPLLTAGWVTLSDSNGFTALLVAANAPLSWPQYFGVTVAPNTIDPTHFDLSVVFAPPGGAVGVASPVVLERFSDLTLNHPDPNYATTRINASSKLIAVPASYTPPPATPTAFAPGVTLLANTGSVVLEDATAVPFLTLATTNPLSWPPLFRILAQDKIATPSLFNLLLLYQPTSGGVGVALPVIVEAFDDVSQATVESSFAAPSDLISVLSFEAEPNPSLSAAALMTFDASAAVPAIHLTGSLLGTITPWSAALDLLAAGPDDDEFVVEVEYDGTATLRFGDTVNGASPQSGTAFTAFYRIGNGTPGMVGADTVVLLAADPRILSCGNPLPAVGALDPETNEQIRRRAPQAFISQERAITMPDYARVTEFNPQVEAAAATPRWTGSWTTVFITAEPECGGALSTTLQKTLKRTVDRYRLAGEDVKLEGPDYVPLQIELTVCVNADYFQADVKQSLLAALGSGVQVNGQPGFFAPGRLTLGQTVYLSPIYAAARAVTGVDTVTATIFQPQGFPTREYLRRGEIPMGPFQVALMDNDPSLPNHGQLSLVMRGGK